jgi:glycosyltransferase involved in cell wall biosynthesis
MGAPLVSIIIPCYNAQDCVRDAIKSALEQTYDNKEIIVIDDGSTDQSLSVIREFGGSIRWETGVNRGGAAARNRGMAIAKGSIVQFLDADDMLDSQKLEQQVPVLLSSGADAVYSDWDEFHADQPNSRRLRSVYDATGDSVVLALERQNIQTEAPIHRKEMLEAVGGFCEQLPCCQERDLHLRLAIHGGRFRRLPGVLHTVRIRKGSVSHNELRVLGWMWHVLRDSYAALEKNEGMSTARRAAFATLMLWQARILVRYGEHEKALAYLAESRRMDADAGIKRAYSPLGALLVRCLGFVAAESLILRLRQARVNARKWMRLRREEKLVTRSTLIKSS